MRFFLTTSPTGNQRSREDKSAVLDAWTGWKRHQLSRGEVLRGLGARGTREAVPSVAPNHEKAHGLEAPGFSARPLFQLRAGIPGGRGAVTRTQSQPPLEAGTCEMTARSSFKSSVYSLHRGRWMASHVPGTLEDMTVNKTDIGPASTEM